MTGIRVAFDFLRADRHLLSRVRAADVIARADGAARIIERIKWGALGYIPRPNWAHGPAMRLALLNWGNTAGSLVACWLNGGTLPRTEKR